MGGTNCPRANLKSLSWPVSEQGQCFEYKTTFNGFMIVKMNFVELQEIRDKVGVVRHLRPSPVPYKLENVSIIKLK